MNIEIKIDEVSLMLISQRFMGYIRDTGEKLLHLMSFSIGNIVYRYSTLFYISMYHIQVFTIDMETVLY